MVGKVEKRHRDTEHVKVISRRLNIFISRIKKYNDMK